ncbi:MAG: trypsin-like peptidase domain-containing protein [Clostridiales bacterium]|jgi:serine protease Do|nr:trypsin-like peptidase domain-containing protein [Clostridiales bacterium]
MDEYRKNFLDLTEIDRIQQEIECNLHSKPQSDNTRVADTPIKLTKLTGSADTPVDAERYYFDVKMSEPVYKPKDDVSHNVFYHETIKNETKRYNKKRFRRNAAITAIICTLGTGTLGVGFGVAYPLAKNYFYPSISDKKFSNFIDASESDNIAAKNEVATGVIAKSSDIPSTIRSVTDVIKLVSPSVVSIRAAVKSSTDYFSLPSADGGSGSGIIFSEDATHIFIATNYHVISGAESVAVNIDDSSDIAASFVGSNPESDLAVISVSKDNIRKAGVYTVSIAIFGDSDIMQVGEPVIAIGNAMGEGNIVTSGIVSAVNKEIVVSNLKLPVIQTDAAINPGNSGGPLINIHGEIIGINTARVMPSDAEGMGFSITSNTVMPILEEIMNQTPKPFLGIQGVDITKDLAEIYQLPNLGVLVQEVVPGSSAQKAGIKRTDIITGFNEEAIFDFKQLSEAIQKCKVGDVATVKVYREGSDLLEFKVKLTEYKTDNF